MKGPAVPALDTADQAPPSRRPTILAADDSPDVLAVLGKALTGAGFTVLLAPGGREAVELYRRHAEDIDLVLLDVRMPGLSGVEALAAIRGIRPAARCWFLTGYSEVPLPAEVPLLHKPFRVDELVSAVRAALATQAP
jgi:CheY-like chemotaxis protein